MTHTNELDWASVTILLFGLLGLVIEPWSPHPPVMVGYGLLYLAARITVTVMVYKLTRKRR